MKNTVKNEDARVYNVVAKNNQEDIITLALSFLESNLQIKEGSVFTSPENATKYLSLKLRPLEHEEFHVLFLDNQHVLIEAQSMFRGTIDGCSVYPREVAKEALRLNAAAVIFAHNHPSGVSEPSMADRSITSKLKEALGLFDIRVLDHFIVGDTTYSFAEHGLI